MKAFGGGILDLVPSWSALGVETTFSLQIPLRCRMVALSPLLLFQTSRAQESGAQRPALSALNGWNRRPAAPCSRDSRAKTAHDACPGGKRGQKGQDTSPKPLMTPAPCDPYQSPVFAACDALRPPHSRSGPQRPLRQPLRPRSQRRPPWGMPAAWT